MFNGVIKVELECRRLYPAPDNHFVFMPDSVPSHQAKSSTEHFLRDNTHTRIGITFVIPEPSGLFDMGHLVGLGQ